MRNPLETSELLAFTQTVDAKSLTRAAAQLHVPRPTISRRLARLEKRLGARLLRRSTRGLALTDAGEVLYRHARIVLEAVTNAERSVRRPDDAIVGELRISVPPLGDEGLHDRIAQFAARHPKLRLQVHASTRHVDLQRDGYDVAIRAGSDIIPGLVARTLFRSKIIAVASPSYVKQHGAPKTARDLRDHRCLMGFARGDVPQTHWRIDGRAVHVEGAFFCNDIALLCASAARGLGIALVPQLFVGARVDAGTLVQVLDDASFGTDAVAIVWAERELVAPQVRAFVDAMVSWRPRGA